MSLLPLLPRPGPKRWVAWTLLLGYPLSLGAVFLALRFVGERWWITTIALYLPRWGFALPLPFVLIGLAAVGARRSCWLETAAAVALVLPLMGLHLTLPEGAASDAPTVRLLTYNVQAGAGGSPALLAEIGSFRPDIVVLQELGVDQARYFVEHMAGYTVQASTQFLVASRFGVQSTYVPPKLPPMADGSHPAAQFIGYTIDTPLGPLDLFSVHPTSPHRPLNALRGEGTRAGAPRGRFNTFEAAPLVIANTALRMSQIAQVAEQAALARHPVVIAGDTNLPEGSWAFSRYFGRFQDAFAEVGNGFGYTFPSTRTPWMRLDRVLAGPELRFVHAIVGKSLASDHHCVVADFRLR